MALTPSPQMPMKSSAPSTSPDNGAPAEFRSPVERVRRSAWATMRDDYCRHGSRLTNGAFIALCVYRFGRWSIARRHWLPRRLASKCYGFVNFFVANFTKIWIPPQVSIGADLHIVNNEGSLSIHPSAVI